MSKFSEALERQRQRFSQGDGDDLYSQLMARARDTNVYDTNIPEIDTRGVEPYDDEWEDSWSKRIQRGFTGLEDIVGLGLKSLGALVKGRTAKSDEQINDFLRDIYQKSGREDTPPTIDTNRYLGDAGSGQILSNLGDYFYNAGHTPEREKAFRPSNKWEGTDYLDLIQSPSKLADYMTDTDEGFLYDLPYNAGNILGFLLPTKATAGTKMASTMNGLAGRIINPVSGLLGKVGADRAANAIRSTAAKEALSDSLHFGTTMAPYGAMVNAGTIIDELKKQGKSDAEIADTMGEMFREELPADIAFAALTGNVLKGNLGKAIAPRGSSLGRKIAAQLPTIPLESAGGYLSNVNQMILSEKYSGQPYGELFGEHTDAEKKAGLMGAMAGLPLSVLGGYRGVRNAQVADQRYAAEQAYSDARKQAYGRQNIAQQALRDARQELGEGAKDSQVLVRANELFNQRINEQAGVRQIDLSGEDEATQKIFDSFAQERAQAAVDNNDGDAASFWHGMFSGNTFNNTAENRAAIRQRYGTELNRFAQTYDPATGQPTQPQLIQTPTPQPQQQGQTQEQQIQQRQSQPQQQQPTAKSTSNKYLRGNDNVMQAGNKFLEELRAKGTQADAETTVRLQAAITSGDEATVRNILEANNRPIAVEQQTAQIQPQQQQQAQQQTDPVKQNQPPENIIQQGTPQQEPTQPQQQAQPKKQPKTPEARAQSALAKPLQSKKGETRRKAGNAVIFLADENGIEISDTDRKSLANGKTAVVNQWRDILIAKGILSPQTTQSPPKQSSPAQSQPQQQTQPQPQRITQPQETTQPQEAAQPAEQPLTLQDRMQQIVNEAIQARNENGQRTYTSRKEHILLQNRQDADEAEAAKVAKESQERFAQARQYHNDQQNDANFEAELPTLRQAQYWLYDNGNEQAAREMEDAISERSLYKAHSIADRTNVPQEILPRVPQRSDAGRRTTPAQNSSTGFDTLVTKARQYQNILMEDGDTQGAQAIEDAIQNRDETALRGLPTTREEISAREEQTRREKQAKEVEAKRQRQEDDAINAALSTPSVDEFSRKKQGAGILKLMNSQSFKDTYGTIELLPGLERALQNGRRKGIEAAQDLLREHGVTERTENPEAAKERGQQQRDAYYEDALDAALEEPSKDKSERQEQGKAILKLLDSSFFKNAKEKVSRLAGLQKGLREGNTKAIRKAQEIIRDDISDNQKQRNTRDDIQARRDARKERQNENREARREERVERADFEDEIDFESELQDTRMDEREAVEELFEEKEEPPAPPEKEPPAKPEEEQKQKEPATEEKAEEEQKQKEPTAEEKAEPPATKEKVTPQDLAKELDRIEDRVKAEGDKDPRPAAPYELSHFAQVTKDALTKILPLNKFPHVFADYIKRIDDTLVEGLHKFGKDPASCIRSIENLRKVCEDVFNDAYSAVRHEDELLRKEGEIDRKTPNVNNSPSEKISEAEVLSDEQSAAKEPSKEVRNLADKVKKLLIERLDLNKALAERLSTTVDGLATRIGDNVARFKAECRNLIAEANSGQLKTRLEADEAAARYGGKRSSSSSKKDPQAAEKAKTRADKLKADIETLLPQLDKYPNLKADIFKIIDRGVDFAGKSGQSSKFSGWASHYLDSLKDLVKEKSNTKEGIEGWLEQQERQLTKGTEPQEEALQEEQDAPHKIPKTKSQRDQVTEADLQSLVDQAWNSEMRAELEYMRQQVEPLMWMHPGSTEAMFRHVYNNMRKLFKVRAANDKKPNQNKPAPQKMADCENIDDVEAYWRSKHNPKIIFDPKLKKLHFPGVKEVLQGVEKTFSLFPDMHSRLSYVTCAPTSRTIASTTLSSVRQMITLEISKNFFADETAVESLRKRLKQNERHFNPDNMTISGIGVHETGHLIEQSLIRRAGLVMAHDPFYSLANKNLVYWAGELITNQKGAAFNRRLGEERSEISEYAKQDLGETIADAITDVFANGTKAKPLSRAIIQRINEALRGDTWRENMIITSKNPSTAFRHNVNTATVAKWYAARRAKGDLPVTEARNIAQTLLYDTALAQELQQCQPSEWEKILESKTPDEKILESGKWTDEVINEYAKDSSIARMIQYLGGTITDGKVQLDAKGRKQLENCIEMVLDPNARYSYEGEPANFDMTNIVVPEKLTGAQKLLQQFADKLGTKMVFFDNPDGRFHGAFSENVTFLNVNSKKGLGGVFWHESFHWLKANNPKLYTKLVDAAGITDKDRQAFLDRTGRKDLKTNEEIDEEILADQMDDVAKRTGLLQSIAGKNRGVVERVVQWLKDTMNKFIETFRNPTGGLTTKQAQALAKEFGRIARQLKDENGEQIFRVNNRTGDIEVVEGRKARELSKEEIEATAKSPNIKYSVDPNDNSSESWGQRVANFARAVIGLRKPAPERIHQKMKRQLSELSDLKIAAGHLPEGVQEKIDEVAKVIRTGKEYDWVKVLPAVGNAVAAQLGITQSAEMGNYIGKFLYGESAPDTSAEAQEFKEAMRKNEDMRDKILACRDTFSQWRNMSTEEQMIASMRFEEEQKPFRTRAQNFWKSFKTQFVESLTPVQSAVDAFEKRTGMKLDDVINPMSAFRLLRGVGGRAQRMIVGGEKTVKALQAALPNLNLDNWKPIRMILEPIGAFEDQKTREAFSAYVTACHVMDIHRQNNNNLKKQAETQSKIDALKDELKLAGNKKERTRIEKSIERQEETLDSLKRNIKDIAEAWDTEEKCQTVINKYKDKFGAAQKELVDYSNTLLAMRVDAGLMTLERFNELLNVYPNYVPLHRVIDEVSGGDKADSMAHMAGSAKDIYDPIHAIMSNTFDTVRRCEKNKAKCLLATLARFDGVGQIFEEVEGGNSDGTTITFYENGKKKHLQCSDDTLVKAVNNLTPASMNWFIRALRIPTVILKGTATVLNINFGARNILRDSQDAYVYGAKHGGNVFKDIAKFMTPYAALKGAYDAFQMNDVFEEFMVNGGAQSTFLTFDANYEQDAFDTLIKGKYKRFASAKGVLKLLETLGSYSELGTRLGRFEQVKGNLKEKHGGINIYGDLVSAALESRDLMDFARGGEAGRTMNAVSAFANPAIQGWDKFFRTFDYKKLKRFGGTDETQRQWMTSAARLVIDSIVPAFLLTLLHHDDDWYKKDVQDWEKETHWILSDTIRIPKPADVGARFLSNFTEKMMEWALNNEPATFKKVFAPLWASLPDLLPTALQPVIECIANYDMFRRSPIVPRRESKLSPEMQYDSQSSNLAKFIGEKAGVSPRYIDHFIYGFTSNFGKGITRGMDTVAYKAGLSDRPPAFTRDWIPIIGGFLRVPYRNPKIVQDYYEALDKQESLLNDYKKHRKSDRNAKPSEEYDRALHARLKGAQNAMQALAAQERKVIEDQRLSSEEVDKRQREIQKRRVALCERVLGKAR